MLPHSVRQSELILASGVTGRTLASRTLLGHVHHLYYVVALVELHCGSSGFALF